MSNYSILAFYHFVTIDDPHEEVRRHKAFFKDLDVMARIYISEEGINGQMSAEKEDAKTYIEWMKSRELFHDVHFKIHHYHEHVFPRLTVKYRAQLVAFDAKADMDERGEHVSPKQWKEMMESDDEYVMLDVRNDYEWEIGHFEGAKRPPCETSRDFIEKMDKLVQEVDKKPVMMYCTGGIRCEIYSALLKEKGVKKIFQLQGGVINYGEEVGSDHWKGKLYVFDDRVAVPMGEEVISTCHFCDEASDCYYNCANMDCNALFLCCPTCLKEHSGCCQKECSEAEHVRPYHHQTMHKPFRRKHTYTHAD